MFLLNFRRAIIRTGNDAGRITEIGLDDIALGGTNSFDLMFFKTPCCGNLCSRYENKRPLSLIAPETGGTRGNFRSILNNYTFVIKLGTSHLSFVKQWFLL